MGEAGVVCRQSDIGQDLCDAEYSSCQYYENLL